MASSYQHLRCAGQAEADGDIGADAGRTKPMGELVGLPVELVVGERVSARDKGNGIGSGGGLRFEIVGQCLLVRIVRRVAFQSTKFGALRIGEQVQAVYGLRGIGNDAFQQSHVGMQEAGRGLVFKQIGAVFQSHFHAVGLPTRNSVRSSMAPPRSISSGENVTSGSTSG